MGNRENNIMNEHDAAQIMLFYRGFCQWFLIILFNEIMQRFLVNSLAIILEKSFLVGSSISPRAFRHLVKQTKCRSLIGPLLIFSPSSNCLNPIP